MLQTQSKPFSILALIMVSACGLVWAVSTYMLYHHNLKQHTEMLKMAVQRQARLMEAIARYDAGASDVMKYGDPDHDPVAATLSQITDAYNRYKSFGESGEFVLARREGESIVFILRHLKNAMEIPAPVPFDSSLAEPMRRALMGQTGSMIGLDYNGKTVLAAYTPVEVLHLGVVAKISLEEVRYPFIHSGMLAAGVAIFVVLVGTILFLRTANPIIETLKENAQRLENEVAEHKQARAEIELQHIRFESLFESIPDALLVTDPERRIVEVNRGFTELFGYTIGEVKGKPTSVIYENEEEFQRQGRERYNMSAEQLAKPYVVTYRKKDGQLLQGETLGTKVVSPDGEALGFFGLIRDISERLRQQEHMRHTQKMEAIGTLAGGIAHDFNNILGSIIGFATIIKERVERGSENEEDIQELLQATRRAKELVGQILAFSRKGSDKAEPVQLHVVVEETMKMLRQTIPSSIDIRQNIDTEQDSVLADPTKLHQIIMNLCTNACHAIHNEDGKIVVRIRSRTLGETEAVTVPGLASGGYVVLTVEDNGEGMSPEVLSRVFEPFYTTKVAGKGTGMGMAVVHGILQSMGGGIDIQSEPGKGTRVDVYLLIFAGEMSDRQSKFVVSPGGSERILVVDDEPALAKVTARLLRKLGYLADYSTSSREALLRIKEDPSQYDLILTDQTMPEVSGANLAAELMVLRPDLPVIICTGYSEFMDEESAKKIGIRALLSKPLEIELLSRVVREVLDQA